MWPRAKLLLPLLACAACASAGKGGPDSGGGGPDAVPDVPDSAGVVPDAVPDLPDAVPDTPDAVPDTPDAAVPVPDAAPAAVCRNGVVEPGETCDDGNAVDTDDCTNACQWARCGDGVVRTGVEECDDGNTADGDACNAICLACAGGDARFTWTTNHHCYTRTDTAADWSTAAASCPGRAHLVTYDFSGENDAVQANLLAAGVESWIGLTDASVEGSFGWITGEPLPYTNWSPGEPNDSGGVEDCAEQYTNGLWNDLDCTTPMPYLCEDEGWQIRPTDHHAYRFVHRPMVWSAALADCVMLGGHLAAITDAAEQTFVAARVTTNLWIGAGDAAVEGTFTWITGEPFAYSAFAPGEPNDTPPGEDCVEIRGDTTWNDEHCDSLRGYVCEID